MSLFSVLKRNSRHALRSCWGKAIRILLMGFGVSLLLGVFLGVTTYAVGGGLPPSNPTMEEIDRLAAQLPQLLGVELLVMLFSVFLLTPLSLGVVSWYASLVKGKPEPFSGIFAYFERIRRYGRALLFSLNMLARTLLWAVTFFTLPAGVLGAAVVFTGGYALGGNRQLAVLSALGMMLACFMLLLAMLLYCAYMNKYYLVPYLMAYDDQLTVRAAIRRSAALTAGSRFSLLWYSLSFLGWILLSALCPPLFFYSIPYMNSCYAMYALYLIERANQAQPEDDCTREFSRAQQEEYPAGAVSEPTVQITPPAAPPPAAGVQPPEPQWPESPAPEPARNPDTPGHAPPQDSEKWPYV